MVLEIDATKWAKVDDKLIPMQSITNLLGLPIDRARSLRQANGGINVIDYKGSDIEVVTLNACLHLEDLG